MNTPDLVTMLGNITQSLYPVQNLIQGVAYILGILFFMTAIAKFRKIGDQRSQSSSHDSMYGPIIYMIMGSMLLFLPTGVQVLSNTAFGTGNVLSYQTVDRKNVYSAVGLLIRTGGLLWFVRGCVLVAHASESGSKDGIKGFMFLIAGVLCINFDNTIAIVNYTIMGVINSTLALKKSQGF